MFVVHSSNIGGHTFGVPIVAAGAVDDARGVQAVGYAACLVNNHIAKHEADADIVADAFYGAGYAAFAAPCHHAEAKSVEHQDRSDSPSDIQPCL